MGTMMTSGDLFSGYRLLRPIGAGGFGEVWLCRSGETGDWRALKIIRADAGSALAKEFEALNRYRRAAGQLKGAPLMPVEHAELRPEGLFYLMPLADGVDPALDPDAPGWRPLTLAALLERRRGARTWFTSAEVAALLCPLLQGLQALSDAGLVHRDVKPDNILFLGGRPHLADISLVTDDRTQVTRIGTPGYATPSWYAGGHADMYGAAATLYTLLTGNAPDKMGRAAFRWPPQGERSLSPIERKEWLRLHSVIRRAVEEKPHERFVDFGAMLESVNAYGGRIEQWGHAGKARTALVLGVLGLATWFVPLFGLPIAVTGLVKGFRGQRSSRRGMAVAGTWLCAGSLLMTVANVTAGYYDFKYGQMPWVWKWARIKLPPPGEMRALVSEQVMLILIQFSNERDARLRQPGTTPAQRLQSERAAYLKLAEQLKPVFELLYAYTDEPAAPWTLAGTPEEQAEIREWRNDMLAILELFPESSVPEDLCFASKIRALILADEKEQPSSIQREIEVCVPPPESSPASANAKAPSQAGATPPAAAAP